MIRNDYLSKQNTDCLKGLLAVMVVVHHSRARMPSLNDTYLGMILTAIGYLAVAAFFFLSGFGLEIQYEKKKGSYLQQFPYTRIIPFYCVCVVSILMYTVFKEIMDIPFTWKEVIQSFAFGKTIVSNGWYLQSILFIYILFYCAYRFVPDHRIWGMTVLVSLYCITAAFLTEGSIYFESVWAFLVGIIWAKYKTRIDKFLCNKVQYIVFLSITAVLLGIGILGGNLNVLPEFTAVLLKMFSAAFFPVLISILLMHIRINYFLTRILSGSFLEVYIVQGICLELFRGKYIYIQNDWVYLILVLVSTFLLAELVKPVFSSTMSVTRRLLQKDKNQ